MAMSCILRENKGFRRIEMQDLSPTVWHLPNNTMWPL
jgi:hypothetical protein